MSRVNLLLSTLIDKIDCPETIAVLSNSFVERAHSFELLDPGYAEVLRAALADIEKLTDYDLVQRLRLNYAVSSLDRAIYARPRFFISKINHGFWEHLAILFTDEKHRATYRDVNISLRQHQYLTNDFLPALLAAWRQSLKSDLVSAFISSTTGVFSLPDALGKPWVSREAEPSQPYKLFPFMRGAVKGLLAFSALAPEAPIPVHDSFQINSDFENTSLFSRLKADAGAGSACVIIGPPRLSKVRVTDWPGSQYFLALSGSSAMAQWRFNLANIHSVVDHLASEHSDITLLFQGAVLGPIFAEHLSHYADERELRLRFIDLGRLLDMAYEDDMSSTGSPLPSQTFTSAGQLELGETAKFLFQRTSEPAISPAKSL